MHVNVKKNKYILRSYWQWRIVFLYFFFFFFTSIGKHVGNWVARINEYLNEKVAVEIIKEPLDSVVIDYRRDAIWARPKRV